MKCLNWILAAAASALIAGCGGGGGDSGTSPFGSGDTTCSASAASSAASACSLAKSIDVVASSVQVGTGGDTVTVSAVVKGVGNVGLPGSPVTFSTNTGDLTQPGVTTDASGVATVTFAAGSDRTNRVATVVARSGTATGSVDIELTGTSLAYSGATTVPLAGTSTVSVKATDSKGAVVSGLPVTVTSSLNNGLSATTLTTDAQGTATLTYTATNSGNDALKFTGGGVSVTSTVTVSSSQFTIVSPADNTPVTVGTAQAITVRYLVNGVAQVGKTVNFSTTAGTVNPTTAITDASGQATVAVSAVTAGPGTVQATVAGSAAQVSVPINFVALAAAKLVLQVSPTAIGPNASGSTAQQTQLRAVVTDANGNPVSGTIVAFSRLQDPSGGNLSQASAVTDSGGQATVQYVAGPGTTADGGIKLHASVLTNPGVAGDTTMTVTQSALFIGLGTGNTITNVDAQTYKKDWVVYVTDSNGVAVANKDLTMKVLPVEYRKGVLVFASGVWTYDIPSLHTCANEDTNYNGVLDVGEDFNGSGNLQPGNVVLLTTTQTATAAASGIARTDSTGRATISLLYAESYVPWIKVRLVAQATVTGTESSTAQEFYVTGLASDFSSATAPPAGTTSPFGVNDCNVPN